MKMSSWLFPCAGFLLALQSWACQTGSINITSLPNPANGSLWLAAINSSGQMTGSLDFPDSSSHAFFFSNGVMFDLGTLGSTNAQGHAINASGRIAGEAGTANGETHAFVYGDSKLTDLGTLGGTGSRALVINDAGQLAGDSETSDGSWVAFTCDGGVLAPLGTLGGSYSTVYGINRSGAIVGESSTAAFNVHGFVYTNGIMTDLGTLGGNYSSAAALNDEGIIVGSSTLLSGDFHAFAYTNGVMIDLGTLGGTYTTATAINRPGQIIGISFTAEQELHSFTCTNGVMIDLGTFGGGYAFAYALNNFGEIVGEAALADGTLHAFLWNNGTLYDLNSLLPPNSGWVLNGAELINDAGRISGYGTLNGVAQWFVMDLLPANNPPIAIAGPNQTVECQSAVLLNGSASIDPDNDPLIYEWSLAGIAFGTNATLSVYLPLGTNRVTLKVTDSCGASSQADVLVSVVDTSPPVITCETPAAISCNDNCQALIPDLVSAAKVTDNCSARKALVITQEPAAGTTVGPGRYLITLTAADSAGNKASTSVWFTVLDNIPPVITSMPAPVVLSADAHCQAAVPDLLSKVMASDICTPSDQLHKTQNPAAGTLLPDGQYLVGITVSDAAGNATSNTVSLLIADTTAPTIQNLAATPNVLSPPNHQLVPVTVSASVTDNCDAAPMTRIQSVTCSDTAARGDIQITGPMTCVLAASKAANGDTRIYTITVISTDASGNSASRTTTVSVPKNNSGPKK
jgi:probable HAF family extracellular repeat protein